MPRRSHSAVWSSGMSSPPSAAEGGAIGSRIRAAHKAAVGIEPDAVGVAEEIIPLLAYLHVVAARGEVVHEAGLVAPLEVEGSRRGAPGAPVEPARRFYAGLRPQVPIEPAREESSLSLGLPLAAHGPIHEARPAGLEIHGRDQRVHGPLARSQHVGLGWVERKEGTAILEDYARVAGDQPRAPREIERLDEGDGIALGIRGDDGNGVAARGPGLTRGQRPIHVEPRAELGDALRGEE